MLAWNDGVPTVAVRLGITYGLGMVVKRDPRFQTVPNRFCAQAAAGERLRVLSGRAAAFVHVRDAVSALRLAARMPVRQPFSVVNAAPDVRRLGEVADLVREACDARAIEVVIEGPGEIDGPRFAVRSSLTSLGWAPTEDMHETVPAILDYFLGQRASMATSR
jgi:nucleoside-diphosphate-sugar epimerase